MQVEFMIIIYSIFQYHYLESKQITHKPQSLSVPYASPKVILLIMIYWIFFINYLFYFVV